ncbi:translation initiation factor SUI1 [Cannes 8 virus]|uniref:Translation initiation factor SUI1 n=1 Tax=Marseillevirus marseillevirus TaxID=694581 RepID=D2XA87_GBMV|nr:translation initiation factor SUI1 [Marseillevirus marseillevirus]YP_009094568.1 putative translation initiation factor SUI1 [Melbournevirus]ADB03864.1 translation initiation factor SUI1 [Marseillevirus marseillevirus]AGV01429.1 translation initiation factor SUI1 [Cannes 8 virus]AIT54680.1 translation initiation factor SUI1 [Melbournevirus]
MLAGYLSPERELERENVRIHISLVRVSKKNFVTRVSGLSSYGPEKVVKSLKRHLCCSGKIRGEELEFQGDQREKISEFLSLRLPVSKESITVHGA